MKSETHKQTIGKLGEDLAVRFLVKHGHHIIARNYRKTFGELDIVSRKSAVLHFIEVKTVSHVTTDKKTDGYRPEDNIHHAKLLRISRTIETYLSEFNINTEWQFDIITVTLDQNDKSARIKYLPDIIL